MRAGALVALLLALPGCAAFRREAPAWARPASTAPALPPGGPAAPPAAPPTPVGTAPGVPPPPPVPPPLPTAPAAPSPGPSSAQSRPLTASLPPAEARRLQEDAQRRIEETERLLRRVEGRPLPEPDRETLRLARSLVEQARKALEGEEYERAANLAAKARTLADDLSSQR
jgi:hypothetical protein